MRTSKYVLISLALFAGLALAGGAAAQTPAQPAGQVRAPLPPEAFFGTYIGDGVANRRWPKMTVTQRELNVTIEPTPDGFAIAWTTVMHKGSDPKSARVIRRDNWLAFVPSGRGTIWRATTEGDPIKGETYAWARIEGDSLITYVTWIDDDGMFDVERYARRITPTGMKVNFRLTHEGADVLTVQADLAKVSK